MTLLDDEMTVSEETLVCAFRYALGRENYVVGNVIRDMLDNAEFLSQPTRQDFIKRIQEKWQVNALGHKNDTAQWVHLLHTLEALEKE